MAESSKKYTANIHYTKDTVNKMSKVVCYANSKTPSAVIQLCGIALMFAGVWRTLEDPAGMAVMVAGILLFTNADFRGVSLGRKMCKVMEGWWPVMNYTFLAKEIVSKTDRETTKTPYKDLVKLVWDDKFFYLFTNPVQAFMIDAQSLDPSGKEEFMKFMIDKTGLKWTSVWVTIFSNRIGLLLDIRKVNKGNV